MNRLPTAEYVLSLSYGKDSIACIEAVKQLGYPLDRIVHAEVWATDTIPADLPSMVEFKVYADKIIKQRYGIEVEHLCAMRNGEKLTYEKMFYHQVLCGKYQGNIKGFPCKIGEWCKKLKYENSALNFERNVTFQYLGIAADEPERIKKHQSKKKILPLVEIGWTEAYCRKWCEENNLLSPIYSTALRGGCWFCHNQSVDQLRLLRRNYPEYWELLLKWDYDSPVTFKADGTTVHDFDKRFELEDNGIILPNDRTFRWDWVRGNSDIQIKLF